MKRLMVGLLTLALLGTAPTVMADRHHDHDRGWDKGHDRNNERLTSRVRERPEHSRPGHHYKRGHHEGNRRHRGHDRRYHSGHDHGYRGYHHRRQPHRRPQGRVIFGFGNAPSGVVILTR